MGIASLPITGGRTSYNRFNILIDLSEHSTCNVKRKKQIINLLCQASLIIWKETPMDHRCAFEAVDKTTMKGIVGKEEKTRVSQLLGGKIVFLGGDFRQLL